MKKQISYKIVSLVFAVLVICFAIAFYAIGWTEPSEAPPGGNVDAPLNTSSVGQSKAGGLILNTGGAVNGLIVDQGNVGIGTTDPGAKLHIDGTPGTDGIMFPDGTLQTTADSGAVDGGGAVKIGVIFGVNAATAPGSRLTASRYRALATGTITHLGTLPYLVTPGTGIVMAIYSDNNNYPGSLLAQTNEHNFVAADADRPLHLELQSPVEITAHQIYWLAFMLQDTKPVMFTVVSRIATFGKGSNLVYSITLPNLFPAGGAADYWWVVWGM